MRWRKNIEKNFGGYMHGHHLNCGDDSTYVHGHYLNCGDDFTKVNTSKCVSSFLLGQGLM